MARAASRPSRDGTASISALRCTRGLFGPWFRQCTFSPTGWACPIRTRRKDQALRSGKNHRRSHLSAKPAEDACWRPSPTRRRPGWIGLFGSFPAALLPHPRPLRGARRLRRASGAGSDGCRAAMTSAVPARHPRPPNLRHPGTMKSPATGTTLSSPRSHPARNSR